MENSWQGQENFSILQLAQYLGGLTIHHQVWREVAQALERFLGAEVVAFGRRSPAGEVTTHDWAYAPAQVGPAWAPVLAELAAGRPAPRDLAGELVQAVAETLDSGFLNARQLTEPAPLALAFLPITLGNRVAEVMLVGRTGPGPFSKDLLNGYLAVAGLVGTTAARLASERELREHRAHLEDLVRRRTQELTQANHQLQGEITRRQEAQEALSHSEAWLRTIIDQAPVLINSFDDTGRCLLWNRECALRLGRTQEEINQAPDPVALFCPDPAERQRVYRAASRADGQFREYRVQAAGGARLDLVMACFRLPDGSGINLGMDVTSRKAAESALAASEHKYRALVENASEAIFILQEGRIAFVNPAGQRLFGLTPAEMQGQELRGLLHPADREASQAWLTSPDPAGDGPLTHSLRLLSPPGRERLLQVSPVPIAWQGQDAVLLIARDVTREQEMEARLRQSQKMEAVGTLAGGIAHEFNNILTVLAGYGELALEDAEAGGSPAHELKQMLLAGDRAKVLVQQILAYSRQMEPRLTPLNINAEISQTLELMRRTLPRMVEVRVRLTRDLGRVKTDPTYIQQVLLNLCSNAADAMPRGGCLTISTEEVEVAGQVCQTCGESFGGRYVRLTVADDGEGMTPATLARIFDPFFTTKEVGSGTGLGLSSVYGIVREHQGHISCASRPGQGATFTIHLPVCETPGRPAPASQPSLAPVEGQQRLILLVDDENDIRAIGREILESVGYRVLSAANGEEALQHFGASLAEIALVILDLNMPGRGGLACLQELLDQAPRTKVLIASGYANEGWAGEARRLGAAGFIAKPFRRGEFLAAVGKVLAL
ncbi:MAG: PAS domain S-box protein [Deltaproteobacteria bacterium]|nr:PAS domain S-box protein [Deltaproteobacteria bacterium]